MKQEFTSKQLLLVAFLVLIVGELVNFFVGGLVGQSVATACEIGFLALLIASLITGLRNRKRETALSVKK